MSPAARPRQLDWPRLRAWLAACVLSFGIAFAGAGHAAAAPYTVIQCAGGYGAAHDFGYGTFHPGTFYGEDGCAGASVLRVRAWPFTSAPHNFGGNWTATAPDGTVFTRFQADFQGGSNGSPSTAPEVYVCGDVWCGTWKAFLAWGNGGDSSGLPGVPGWGSPGTRVWTGSGGLVVRFGLGCAWGDCLISQWGAGIDMFGARFTLDDQASPAAPAFTVPASWRRGAVPVTYSAADRGSGVRQVHLHTGDGSRRATDTRPCWTAGGVYTRLVPCPLSASGTIGLDTTALPDGAHQLNLVAEDASGQGAWGAAQTIRVDNHAPTAPVSVGVEGGEGWRRGNSFDVRWANPGGQHAPLTKVHYTLCRPGGGCAPAGVRPGANPVSLSRLEVPGGGDWLLRLHLEDEAGNVEASHPSEPVHLRFDPDPPERVEFQPLNPEDPQRIAVAVADATSGVAGGTVEVRPESGGPWRLVPTQLEGSELVARLDDTTFEPGFYELRATARDHAGNERSSEGAAAQRIYLPVRLRSRITLRASRPSCKRVSRGTDSQAKPCRTGFLRAQRHAVSLEFRGRALVRGQVETVDGVPIRGATVDVLFRHSATDRPLRGLARIRTDADGRFAYLLPRRPSGTYRFRYEGSPRFGPGASNLVARVRARLSFKASRRHVPNGETVNFSGRLVGRPVPRLGRTVDVQAWIPGSGWRTFATPRTDRRGRFAVPYTFRFTSGVQRYRLRALLERSGDYPYERSSSRVVRVTVRG